MALKLYFEQNQIPRTTTRREWKEIWRWKRIAEKKLDEITEKNREVLIGLQSQILVYGSAQMRMRDDLIAEMINPPLLIPEWVK